MRKIVSKEKSEKKAKRNQLIIGIILTIIMFSSVIGYSLLSNNSSTEELTLNYNGIKFTKNSNLWNANIGNLKFSFAYNPKETGKIYSEINPLESYIGKPLYLMGESEEEIEFYRNFFYNNQIVERVNYACLEGETCLSEDYPVKNCENNFIIIKESNETKIKQQENCLFISSEKEELMKIVDSVLFEIIEIQ